MYLLCYQENMTKHRAPAPREQNVQEILLRQLLSLSRESAMPRVSIHRVLHQKMDQLEQSYRTMKKIELELYRAVSHLIGTR